MITKPWRHATLLRSMPKKETMTRPLYQHLAPIAALACAALTVPFAAHAQDAQQDFVGKEAGTVMVRLRAIDIAPLDSSSSISIIGGSVHIPSQWAPEVDGSYFFTDHVAAEVVFGSITQASPVQARGTKYGVIDVGSTHALAPILALQYQFSPHERLSPYLGAGVTTALFYGDSVPSHGATTKLDVRTTAGPVVQAGVDYNVTGHWFLNADVKLLLITADANIDTRHSQLKAKVALNPVVAGVGIGYRF